MKNEETNVFLADYELFTPPYPLDFRNMSDKEACEYFEWFIQEIPKRLKELERVSYVSLDFSENSISLLGSWFGKFVETRPRTYEELEIEYQKSPSWLHQYIGRTILTEETLSLCIDIAIYFGEVLRRRHPRLRWDFVKKPKRDAHLHQPVIVPFPHNMHLNPVPFLVNVAGGVFQGEEPATELRRLLAVWEEMLLKDGSGSHGAFVS